MLFIDTALFEKNSLLHFFVGNKLVRPQPTVIGPTVPGLAALRASKTNGRLIRVSGAR